MTQEDLPDMTAAIRLIAGRSIDAGRQAIRLLRTPPDSPLRQSSYNRIAEMAVTDPSAEFTPAERELIAAFVGVEEPDEERSIMLRIRLTEAERATLQARAAAAGLSMSEYARRRMFE